MPASRWARWARPDGFNKLCAGRLDVAAASRTINATEITACGAHGIGLVELPVAFDALSVVVEPEAQGRVMRWNDVRRDFPPNTLTLLGPGKTSGTFDYFTLAIVGAQDRSRGDYTKSDDDTFLADAVAADPNALGYFGHAYYLQNRDRLKAVGIDNGRGGVMPGPGTVMDETYQPLSRPISYTSASQPFHVRKSPRSPGSRCQERAGSLRQRAQLQRLTHSRPHSSTSTDLASSSRPSDGR